MTILRKRVQLVVHADETWTPPRVGRPIDVTPLLNGNSPARQKATAEIEQALARYGHVPSDDPEVQADFVAGLRFPLPSCSQQMEELRLKLWNEVDRLQYELAICDRHVARYLSFAPKRFFLRQGPGSFHSVACEVVRWCLGYHRRWSNLQRIERVYASIRVLPRYIRSSLRYARRILEHEGFQADDWISHERQA